MKIPEWQIKLLEKGHSEGLLWHELFHIKDEHSLECRQIEIAMNNSCNNLAEDGSIKDRKLYEALKKDEDFLRYRRHQEATADLIPLLANDIKVAETITIDLIMTPKIMPWLDNQKKFMHPNMEKRITWAKKLYLLRLTEEKFFSKKDSLPGSSYDMQDFK